MNRRLHVVVVPEWYPSAIHPVAGVFVRDQARAMAETHDITVLTHDDGSPGVGVASWTDRVEDGLRTIRVRTIGGPGSLPGRMAFVAAATRALASLRRECRPVDVLHAHVFSAGLLALLIGHGRVPVVLSEHHSDFIERKVRGRDARLGRLAMRRAALVCPVSPLLEHHLRAFEPRGRYEVVPNVVDVDAFASAGRASEHRRAPGKVRLVAVGLLTYHKGIEYLLKALPGVRRVHRAVTLDVVGDGPLREQLEELTAATLPADAVTFHGLQSRRQVVDLVTAADILVAPSLVESFGVVLVEALAAGLPVVTTREVGLAKAVEQGLGAVVPARDVAALEEALRTVIADLDAFPAEQARRYAQSYGAAAVARRWDDIYTRLARPS